MFPEDQHSRWQLISGTLMEPVLLGLAAPAAAGTAGNLLERTFHTAAEPFAALLDAFTSALSSQNPESTSAVIDSVDGQLESLQTELATEIESALTAAGIDLTEPIALRISKADGQLEVAGAHPQKALIEAALADNPDLARKFTAAVALEQLLTATDRLEDSDAAHAVELGEAEHDAVTALFTKNDDGTTLEFR
jgi:hypothetical protein